MCAGNLRSKTVTNNIEIIYVLTVEGTTVIHTLIFLSLHIILGVLDGSCKQGRGITGGW